MVLADKLIQHSKRQSLDHKILISLSVRVDSLNLKLTWWQWHNGLMLVIEQSLVALL